MTIFPRFISFLKSFRGLLWMLCFIAILLIFGYPLLENVWAYWTWERVPCAVSPNESHFFFTYKGVRYYSEDRDFWYSANIHTDRAAGGDQVEADNAVCYVKPHDPSQAVLHLDAFTRLDRAAPRFGVAMVTLVTTFILDYAIRKQKNKMPVAGYHGAKAG